MERGTKAMQLGSVHHALVCVFECSVDSPSVGVGVEEEETSERAPRQEKGELHEGRLEEIRNGNGNCNLGISTASLTPRVPLHLARSPA